MIIIAEFRKNYKVLSSVLILSLLFSLLVIWNMQTEALRQEKERISYIALTQASKLQSAINNLFQKTQTLKMLVIQGEGTVANFEQVAQELLDDTSIRSLQLAPKGVVTTVYPLVGNEEAFGDLFSDPDRATEAIYARDTGKLTMSGPFVLAQGGFGVVGRQPVFLADAQGKKQFWGFTIIVLDLPVALKPADLQRLVQEGYDYKLHRKHPDSNEIQVFAQSGTNPLPDSVDVSFAVPNTNWTLSIAPQNGWVSYSSFAFEITVAVFISSLITLLTYMMLSLNAQRNESRQLSVTDVLTGLYNRRQLQAVLKERCNLPHRPFLLCYIDLNDFKNINDTLGHDYGDRYLIACANRFKQCLNAQEMLFRIGGDEFVIIMEQTNQLDEAQLRIAQLEKQFSQPFLMDAHVVIGSASIGVALYPQAATEVEQLINLADTAMYKQKAKYKNAKVKF